MATFTNQTKNTSTKTNQQKNVLLTSGGIWSDLVLPWQLSLPWQYVGGTTDITWSNRTKN